MNLFVIILYLFFHNVNCSLETKYYRNLIQEKISESEDFIQPTSNEEFRAGVNSDVIHYFGSYDFIIVGSGSSGSVLATRLSEVDHFTILLLEAGGEENDFSNIPAMWSYLQFSDMNWGYYSTKQNNSCLGMKDQKCMIARGKAIGGSSAINGVFYSRGNANDYNKWAELGNTGWSYKDVLPYFIKSENSQINGDEDYHGKSGFWNVEYVMPASSLLFRFINASKEIGAPIIVDYNGLNQIGSSRVQVNIKRGKRQSTGTAFLENARKRHNFDVVTKALVTKVIIDPKTKVAKGVEFVRQNQKFNVTATKEVIVSGGAINSPQLLMLSGVGPRDHLEEMGIEVLADLPVGENLLEHPLFPGLVFKTNEGQSSQSLEESIKQFLAGYGRLTTATGVDSIGFRSTKSMKVPTIEYVLIRPELEFLSKSNSSNGFNTSIILLHEKSRGRITLKSRDPIDFPNIDINLLAEQEDIDDLIEGIEFFLNLTKTDSFKAIHAELINIPFCTEFAKYSKQYWECVIRQMTITSYHPCGTTAMGSNSTTSVVDNNLKVHGIEHLRVVDAGIFPTSISGHPSAPAVMVAEKIADVIKSDYKMQCDTYHNN